MADAINTDQMFQNVTLVITNSHGDPASVEGPPVWAVSDPTVLQLGTVAADGMSVDTISAMTVGSARVSVTADADLGAGTQTITGFADVEVTLGPSSQASVMTLSLGAPVAKP